MGNSMNRRDALKSLAVQKVCICCDGYCESGLYCAECQAERDKIIEARMDECQTPEDEADLYLEIDLQMIFAKSC